MQTVPRGAWVLLEKCAAVKKGELVLVVADLSSAEVARVLAEAGAALGDTVLVTMRDRTMHGQEPPSPVAAAMLTADVVFGVTKYSLFHAQARREACRRGTRFVNMVDYDLAMLGSEALLVDFDRQALVVEAVAKLMGGRRITVNSPSGTSLSARIDGRRPLPQYGRSVKEGACSSPPDIECAIAPLEGTADGVIVVDGSVPCPGLGLLAQPLKVLVREGMVREITGGKEAERLREALGEFQDERAYAVGEIGLGLNPRATLRGRMLEDEGSYGTVHFGLGSNVSFGGTIAVSVHLDLVVRKATCVVDGRTILREGELVQKAEG